MDSRIHPPRLPSSSRTLLALVLCLGCVSVPLLSSCFEDSATSPSPSIDPTRKDTSKSDTTKKDTIRKDTGSSTGNLPVFKARRDTLFLSAGAGSGTSVRYVVLQASYGSTYNIQVYPGKSFKLRVVAARPDSTPQVTDPLEGDSLVFPCTNTGTYLVRVTGPANVRAELRLGSNAILPMYWQGSDSYEYDGDMAHATRIDSIAGSQAHSSDYPGIPDIDWIKFGADSGWTYTIRTRGTFTSFSDDMGRPRVAVFTSDSQQIPVRDSTGKSVLASFRRQTVFVRMEGHDNATVPYVVSVSGKAGLPATALPPDIYEPDDSANSAKPILVDSIGQTRTLHGDSLSVDFDRIALAADSNTTYFIRLEASVLPRLEIRTPEGILLPTVLSRDSAGVRIHTFPSTRSGLRFLIVSGLRAVAYRIRLSAQSGVPAWTPSPDSLEPDDTRSQAIVVPAGAATYNRSVTAGDVDWYRVTADSGTLWTGALQTSDSRRPALRFDLYPGNDTDHVLAAQAQAGSPARHSHFFSRRETIFLRVTKLDTAVQVPYTLVSRIAPGQDPGEPDDDSAHAWELPLDGRPHARTLEADDVDWVRFRASAGQIVRFQLDPVDGNRTIAWFAESADGKLVQNQARGAFELLLAKDMEFRVQIEPDYGYTDSSTTYSILASAETVQQDTLEPDDTPRPLRIDSTWVARDIRTGDVDQMSVSVPANQACIFQQKGLYNANGGPMDDYTVDLVPPQGMSLPRGWFLGDVYLYNRTAGTYQIRIASGKYLQTSVPYKIAVSCRTVPDSLEPDEGIHSAVELPYDSLLRRRFVAFGDQDWMHLPFVRGTVRYLQMIIPSTSNGFVWGLSRKDSSTVYPRVPTCVVGSDLGTTSCLLRIGDLSDTGDLYFYTKVTAGGEFFPYQVRTWMVSNPDLYESDDTSTRAPFLGTEPTDRWISKGDVDLFRLHLSPSQAVRIVTTGPVRWGLQRGDGSSCSPCLVGGSILQSDTAADYLLVLSPSTDSAIFQPYTAKMVSAPFDSGHRHATRATAIPVPSDSTVVVGTTSYSDTVWYRIRLRPDQTRFVHARSDGHRLALFSQDSVRQWDSLGLVEMAYLSNSDTAAYVGVAPRTDSLILDPVELWASAPIADRYEPDNDILHASSIDSGAVQLRTMAIGDTDIIRLPAGPTGNYRYFLVYGRACMTTEVLDSTGRELGYNNQFSGDPINQALAPTGPSYFLRFVGIPCLWKPHQGGGRYSLRPK